MKIPKTVECKPLLLIGALLMTNLSYAQLDLKLDSDTPSVKNTAMPMLDLALYSVDDDVMSVVTEFPILCTHILGYEPISDVQLRVDEPNSMGYEFPQLRDFNLGVGQNVSYDLLGKSINIRSENRNKAKCVASTLHDVISSTGFEEIDQDVIEVLDGFGVLSYEGLPDEVNGSVAAIDYEVTYTNTSAVQQKFDYMDYWPFEDTDSAHFTYTPADDWFLCNEDDPGIGCGYYKKFRVSEIRSAVVNPGQTLRISYSKFLINPLNSAPGQYINMMAGIFIKTDSAEGIDGFTTSGSAGEVYLNHVVVEKRIKVN